MNKKIAVLVSGGGTNLQAIIDAVENGTITNTEIKVVISNNKNAYALERAKNHNIEGICISPKDYESRAEFNKAFFDVIREVQPEEVYLPFWGDMQKDHQMVTDAAMVALRSKYDHPVKRIYAYETLSETGINLPTENYAFIPNVYVDITDYLEGKLTALNFFKTQVSEFPDLRSLEANEALAKLRGATVNVKAAEAFMLIRETK